MASLFSRRREQPAERQAPENRPDQQHELLRAFLPASARPFDTQRLTTGIWSDADTDGPDEEIEFLESLVQEIDSQPVVPPSNRRPPPQAAAAGDSGVGASLRPRPELIPRAAITMRVPSDDDSNLNVFRAMRDEPDRTRTSRDLGVRDVDLDDLLEDLSTTAAAIRRRKAA